MEKFGGISTIDEDDLPDIVESHSKTAKSIVNNEHLADHSTGQSIETQTDDLDLPRKWESANELLVSFQEKANGKFACFQLFEYNNNLYLFGGSKNVHIIEKIAGPAESEHDSLVFSAPVSIGTPASSDDLQYAIMNKIKTYLLLAGVDNPNIQRGKTYIGEYVDGKHIVYTKTPYMVFFDSTLPDAFPKTGYLIPNSNKMPSVLELNAVRNMINVEGCVILYQNTTTKQVIRKKHKTKWYVIWRSFREVIKSKPDKLSADDLYKLLKKRLHERSSGYLHLNVDELQYWEDVAMRFVKWLKQTPYKFADVGPFSPIGLAKVLQDFNADVKFEVLKDDPPAVSNPKLVEYIAAARKFGLSVVIKGNPDIVKYYQNKPVDPYRAVSIVLNSQDTKKESIPMYYGLFPKTSDINKIIRDMGMTTDTTTPFHITVQYVGGSAKNNIVEHAELLGSETVFYVVGYSTNIAGVCLKTKHPQLSGNHITISVSDGFKPAHVGTEMTLQNSFEFATHIPVHALYLPMYN
jgi:hypothetical protein